MNPLRTQLKFFLDQPTPVDQSIFTGVFQRWIQQKALSGQLIDVADYRHVHEGPGIMLIAHDSDYAMETRDERLGLLFTRKRRVDPDLQAQVRASLALTLAACQLLEAEPAFQPRLKFRVDEIEVRFLDRLQLPNRPESFELVKDDLRAVFRELYDSDDVEITPANQDARYLFTIRVRSDAANITALLRYLQPYAAK